MEGVNKQFVFVDSILTKVVNQFVSIQYVVRAVLFISHGINDFSVC